MDISKYLLPRFNLDINLVWTTNTEYGAPNHKVSPSEITSRCCGSFKNLYQEFIIWIKFQVYSNWFFHNNVKIIFMYVNIGLLTFISGFYHNVTGLEKMNFIYPVYPTSLVQSRYNIFQGTAKTKYTRFKDIKPRYVRKTIIIFIKCMIDYWHCYGTASSLPLLAV